MTETSNVPNPGPFNSIAAPDCTMIIFGASGDLTKRLLFPSLCNMSRNGHLPKKITIVGVALPEMDDVSFREYLGEAIGANTQESPCSEVLGELLKNTYYIQGDFLDPKVFEKLKTSLCDTNRYPQNFLFYLATPPQFFGPVVDLLCRTGLMAENASSWRRVVVEKPFGRDLASAKALNKELTTILSENQIFRMDHYLGKETVQNVLVFRFLNGMFEPIWNRNYIDHIQITVAEQLGVETRAGYYEGAGALRDMVQNHLFQLLSLAAMDPPNAVATDSVRDEKAQVLQSVTKFSEEYIQKNVVRGQYVQNDIQGSILKGYRDEAGVSPVSNVETYVAMKLEIESWRWAGVPFYLRTGKRLNKKMTEIAVQFRKVPSLLLSNAKGSLVSGNWLVIRIQPDEGISLEFSAKRPGPRFATSPVRMDFDYAEYFEPTRTTGYETLLYDAMAGDRMLFQRADSVEEGWSIVQPILELWEKKKDQGLYAYTSGSWGPKEAEDLLERDGRMWRHISDASG